MASNETIITTKLRVTGLDQLEKANSLMNKLKSAGNFKVTGSGAFGKMASQMDKAAAGAERLRKAMSGIKEAGNAGNGIARIASEMNKATQSSEKLESSMRQAMDYSKQLSSAGEKLAASQTKAATSAEKFETAQRQSMMNMNKRTQTYKQQGESIRQSTSGWVKSAAQAEKTASSAGKIKMALGDAFAMFSVGQLGMTGVMAAVEGVKSAFTGGYETIKERQKGQAMWATSIQDSHPNVTGSKLTKQSNAANRMIMSTAIKAGNDYSEANAMAKQVYSSDAGKYSGNVKKTNSLVRGMFNVQDANNLNDMDMMRMRTAVGNIGDTGKMNGNIAKSLNLLDGKMTRAIRKEYKKRTGHDLAKNKAGNYDWSKVDAETAYAGLDAYGNSGGVGKASDRTNRTLGGMTRAGKAALNNGMADFETAFANRINKSFGGKGGIIGKLSGFFTDTKRVSGVANSAAKGLASLAVGIGEVGKVGMGAVKSMKPFATGFVKGFASEYKSITNGIKSAYDTIKGIGKSIEGVLPKGTGGKLKEMLSGLGSATGKVTAFLLALRGFSKIPVLGKGVSSIVNPVAKLLGKIPGVGKVLSGFVRTLTGVKPEREMTAASKMSSAGDKMLEAAGKMNGTGGTGGLGVGGEINPSSYKTRAEYQAAKRSARKMSLLDRVFESGAAAYNKGGIKGKIGGVVAKGAYGLQQAFSKISSSKLGTGISKITGFVGKTGSALGKVGKVFSRSGGGMAALFGAFDIASAFGSTKKGTLARHQAVGSATGSTVGSIAGGMLGSLLGPVGTVVGGVAGGAAGSWLGKIIGGKFGGKKSNTKTVNAYQQEAQNSVARSQLASNLVTNKGAANKSQAYAQIRTIGRATSIKSKGAQKAAAKAQQDLNNGNYSGYAKNTAKAAKDTAKYYANAAKSASKKVSSDKKAVSNAKELAKATGNYSQLAKAQSKLSKDKKKESSASKKASKADKDSVKLGNKSVSSAKKSSKESSKAHKSEAKSAKESSKKINKAGKEAYKGHSKAAQKAAKDSVKAQKSAAKQTIKSMKKQSSDLKKALKSQTKGQKTQLKDMQKNQKSAFKGMNKSAQSAFKKLSKAVTKGMKSASKASTKSVKALSKGVKTGMKSAQKAAKSGAKSISKSLKSGLKNVGKVGKTSFKSLSKSVKSGLKSAKSAAKSGAKGIGTAVKSGLKNVGKSAKSAFKSLPNAIKSGMSKAKSAARSGARGIVSAVKSGMSKMGSAGKAGASKLASSVKSGMNKAKSAARSGANQIVSAVKSGMSKMSSAGQAGTSKLASSVRSGMNQVASAAKSGVNKAASSVKSGFNKMASAAQSASSRAAASMSKIGSAASSAAGKVRSLASAINSLHSKTITIKANVTGNGASKLATGTPGAKSAFHHLANGTPGPGSHLAGGWAANGGVKTGMYVVNDAPGSNFQEAFKMRNGLIGLFPKKRNLHVPLLNGMQVLNGEDTHKMFPHLAKGSPGAKRSMVAASGGKAPVINITVNVSVDGSSKNGDFTKMANEVANAIGEKFKVIMPRLEV